MSVSFSEIAAFARDALEAAVCDDFEDFQISGVASIDELTPGHLAYSREATKEIQERIAKTPGSAIFLPYGVMLGQPGVMGVVNPRLAFAKVAAEFFAPKIEPGIHPTAVIHSDATVDSSATIGAYSVIGPNCVVGPRVVLKSHVTLSSNVEIGADSTIWSHAVIGDDGFAVERSDHNLQMRVPHFGGVRIGKGVHIGTMATVAAGTMQATEIGDGTMVDNLVHIAHNCNIGANCQVIACAEVSGSVVLGDNVTLGPNTSVIQKVTIGANSISGLGAVITKSVPENVVVAGVPARIIRNLAD